MFNFILNSNLLTSIELSSLYCCIFLKVRSDSAGLYAASIAFTFENFLIASSMESTVYGKSKCDNFPQREID